MTKLILKRDLERRLLAIFVTVFFIAIEVDRNNGTEDLRALDSLIVLQRR